MKILAAMSGGIDSSVAAALLKEQGHDVIGATMALRPFSAGDADNAEEDAGKVAAALGIPHHVYDLRDVFASQVIDYFCEEYRNGRTPNPCVICNPLIKFGALWEKAREAGADALATGHYAGTERANGKYRLKKGADVKKDQSYFLYRLTQEQLSRTLFPLAALTKEKVKQMAREMRLPVGSRPESQEICFIPDNDYAGFLEKYTSQPALPGFIIDKMGNKVGQHHGITHYTIGQRKGLGIASPKPLYVTGIDAVNNTVTVGLKTDTYSCEAIVTELNWIALPPLRGPAKVAAKVRYHHQEVEAIIEPVNEKEIYVRFSTPQMAVTPGQSVVFYDGDYVIGGGIIIRQGR